MTKQIRVRYTKEQENWIREVYYKVDSYDELTLLFNQNELLATNLLSKRSLL